MTNNDREWEALVKETGDEWRSLYDKHTAILRRQNTEAWIGGIIAGLALACVIAANLGVQL